MGKTEKLIAKLEAGIISAAELRTLMKKLGWVLDRTNGSHEQWLGPDKERLTLATHSKDLMPYQVKEAQTKVKE